MSSDVSVNGYIFKYNHGLYPHLINDEISMVVDELDDMNFRLWVGEDYFALAKEAASCYNFIVYNKSDIKDYSEAISVVIEALNKLGAEEASYSDCSRFSMTWYNGSDDFFSDFDTYEDVLAYKNI